MTTKYFPTEIFMEILISDSLEAGAEKAASVVKKIINSKENHVLGLAT